MKYSSFAEELTVDAYEAKTGWEVIHSGIRYFRAIPILLKWLPLTDDPMEQPLALNFI